jgi:hypothetical protein
MASDYTSIRAKNERRYGTDIGRIGKMLLAERYDDRTHFIFELLQNAEDALARRSAWGGSRAVKFVLSEGALRVSHSGMPFDNRDVRSICGIAESTKDLTAIGSFGIGFKSVYAFTERPEIHSGDEDFAIESYVWPVATSRVERGLDETIIVLPLAAGNSAAHEEVAEGLQRLGPRTLLFLRQIEEIDWSVEDGPSGLYLRSEEALGANIRQVTVIGEEHGKSVSEEAWLVFSQEARTDDDVLAGHVEIAFSMTRAKESDHWSLQAVSDSPLVVFFPTVLPTYLGFLAQGPYRTTPSRDNVPRSDPWNQRLVGKTEVLLVNALGWLRDQGMLDTVALRCLPLDHTKFEYKMFAPLFAAVREAFKSEPLLPCFGDGYVAAGEARLAYTQELRDLFSRSQLGSLFGGDGELVWLSGDISQDRTPEIRQYLMQELDIAEIRPETILARLNKAFLEAQPDEWIVLLYEFLNGQSGLRRRLDSLPLIRLEDSTHVTARSNEVAQAFLPGRVKTSFPTVRRAVCTTDEARAFLQSLGLTEPNPVDDVIRNILPRYRGDDVAVGGATYKADIQRILAAFDTDSKTQREQLVAALRTSSFVKTVDAGNGSKQLSKPGDVYLATERLKGLFAEVAKVLLVDDSYACLRGEDIRELLEACGATRHLQTVLIEPHLKWERKRELRVAADCENISGGEEIEDFTIRGLAPLLVAMRTFDGETRRKKATWLWDALGDLEDRRGSGIFSGTYRWTYHYIHSAQFDATFVQQLNTIAWVPDANGDLHRPESIVFDMLDWKPNPLLLSKIRFKPPIIETLAKEAGFEPGVLELLKKLGLTSEAELRSRLGVEVMMTTPNTNTADDVSGALTKLLGDVPDPTPPVPDPTGPEPSGSSGGSGTGGRSASGGSSGNGVGRHGDGQPSGQSQGTGGGTGKRTPGSTGGRPFISYVGAHPDEGEGDPDGLDQAARMALEAEAIERILLDEPSLQRTPVNNPGFDLFEAADDHQPARWVEVKAMTGSLRDRPVGLSRKEFDCAREHGDAYWLYVVEHAGDESNARIVRIQDPAGKAQTFTFDHGWLDIAELAINPTGLRPLA